MLSIVLVWLIFRNQDLSKIMEGIRQADYRWIFLSFFISLVSHFARASRWRQLYLPIGYSPSTIRVFLAIMFGYFMNVIIPRAGEISRCALLRRTDKIPLDVSIGTVVAERAFDILTILLLILAALTINFSLFADIYQSSLDQIPQGDQGGGSSHWVMWSLVGLGIAILVSIFFRKKLLGMRTLSKIRSLLRNVWKGAKSIGKVKNKPLFIWNTLVIWVMYFFLSYVVFFAIPATSHLGWEVGLTVLVVSGIAMLVPVQGGIGAYHLFVSTALVFYGLSKEAGLVYATLMHASQLVLYLVGGGVSFLVGVFISPKAEK